MRLPCDDEGRPTANAENRLSPSAEAASVAMEGADISVAPGSDTDKSQDPWTDDVAHNLAMLDAISVALATSSEHFISLGRAMERDEMAREAVQARAGAIVRHAADCPVVDPATARQRDSARARIMSRGVYSDGEGVAS